MFVSQYSPHKAQDQLHIKTAKAFRSGTKSHWLFVLAGILLLYGDFQIKFT